MATLFARRGAKTRIRLRDWLKLAGAKIRREQVESVPTFLSVRANKVAKWKIGLNISGAKFYRSSMSSKSQLVTVALGEKYSSMIKESSSSVNREAFKGE